MCVNAPANHEVRYDDLERVGYGLYRRRRSPSGDLMGPGLGPLLGG
jgi:hypothetical protein